MLPGNLIHKTHKQGCPHCFGKVRKTTKQFIEEVENKFGKEKYDLSLVEYINNRSKVKLICKYCNEVYECSPRNIMRGIEHNCQRYIKIANKRKLTKKEIGEHLLNGNRNLIVNIPENYENTNTYFRVTCKKCGYNWEMRLLNIIKGRGCPYCIGRNHPLSVALDTLEKQGITDIKFVENQEYTTKDKKYKFQCKKCNHIWEAKFQNIQSGKGCPSCNNSNLERNTKIYLQEKGIKYMFQYMDLSLRGEKGRPYKFDFYLPEKNVMIECDGEQHYNETAFIHVTRLTNNVEKGKIEFKKLQERDKRKENYCIEKGIRLIRVPYSERNYLKIKEYLDRNL